MTLGEGWLLGPGVAVVDPGHYYRVRARCLMDQVSWKMAMAHVDVQGNVHGRLENKCNQHEIQQYIIRLRPPFPPSASALRLRPRVLVRVPSGWQPPPWSRPTQQPRPGRRTASSWWAWRPTVAPLTRRASAADSLAKSRKNNPSNGEVTLLCARARRFFRSRPRSRPLQLPRARTLPRLRPLAPSQILHLNPHLHPPGPGRKPSANHGEHPVTPGAPPPRWGWGLTRRHPPSRRCAAAAPRAPARWPPYG